MKKYAVFVAKLIGLMMLHSFVLFGYVVVTFIFLVYIYPPLDREVTPRLIERIAEGGFAVIGWPKMPFHYPEVLAWALRSLIWAVIAMLLFAFGKVWDRKHEKRPSKAPEPPALIGPSSLAAWLPIA